MKTCSRLTKKITRLGRSAFRTVVFRRACSPLSRFPRPKVLRHRTTKSAIRTHGARERGTPTEIRAAGTVAPYSGMPAGKRSGKGNAPPDKRAEREKAFPATRLCRGKGLSETVFYTAPIVCPSRRADSPPRRPCRSGKARSGCRRRCCGTWTGRTRCRSSCFPTCGRSSGRPARPGR